MKATESEKMKTAFLNSICHEIRTPLNSIAGVPPNWIFDESLDTDRQTRIPAVDTKQFYRVSFFDGQDAWSCLSLSAPNYLFLWSLPTYTDYVLKKWPNLRKLCPSRISNVSSQAIKTE